jgi:hypothetical protein
MFERGTLFRHALAVLRAAQGPLTTREVVVAMLEARGLFEPTTKQVRDLYGGVQSSLRNWNGKTVVRVGDGAIAVLPPDATLRTTGGQCDL